MPPPIYLSAEYLLRVLFNCRNNGQSSQALQLHTYIQSIGMLAHSSVGNTIVPLLAQLGDISRAHFVFDRLTDRHQNSWDSLIICHVKHENFRSSLSLYQSMVRSTKLHPSMHSFVSLLKACSVLKDLETGSQLHGDIKELDLLQKDIFIGSTLVYMYAKLGYLEKAKEVFDRLPTHNVVSWTAMATAYSQSGYDEEALSCLEQMQQEGISASSVTYICTLKACVNSINKETGQVIHSHIVKKGYSDDIFICSTLVDFYAKCSFPAETLQIFEKATLRDVVLWTALISGYAELGLGEKALASFEQMQRENISPNSTAFIATLKACAYIGDLEKGTEIHTYIISKGIEKDPQVGNTLIDMYSKCGSIIAAQFVFDQLLLPDIVSWNVMMAAYVEYGFIERAFDCYKGLKCMSLAPSVITYVYATKACSDMGGTARMYEIHLDITKIGLEGDPFIGSTLIDVYARCGFLIEAQQVSDKLSTQTSVSVNVLMGGYVEFGHNEEALCLFDQFIEFYLLDSITVLCILKACSNIRATARGQKVHVLCTIMGSERDYQVANAQIDMYAKCGLYIEAQNILIGLPIRDVFSWTPLLTGYVEHGHAAEALFCIEQMRREFIEPDVVTLVCGLTACSCIHAETNGLNMHVDLVLKGLEQEVLVGNTLITMYARFGWLAEAKNVFDKLPNIDVISWNALIAGYADRNSCEEALEALTEMRNEGFSTNANTLVSCFVVCSNMGIIDACRNIHSEIVKKGLSETDTFAGRSLVDMYAKCGLLPDAQDVFSQLSQPSVMTWNTLIGGYAQLGASEIVFRICDRMVKEDVHRDAVTFVNVLNACSNAGRVDEGQIFYELIFKCHESVLNPVHHACMVDMFGRAGYVEMAVEVLKHMPFHPGIVLWLTVLGACRKWGNVELGRFAFDHAVQSVERDPAAYVCMFNIYADAALNTSMGYATWSYDKKLRHGSGS